MNPKLEKLIEQMKVLVEQAYQLGYEKGYQVGGEIEARFPRSKDYTGS